MENRFKVYIQIKNDHNLQNGDYKIDVLEKNVKKESTNPKKQKVAVNQETVFDKKPDDSNKEEVKTISKNSRNKKRSAKKKLPEHLQTPVDIQTQKLEIQSENEVTVEMHSEQKENETVLEKESEDKTVKSFNKKRPRRRHRVKYSKKNDESKAEIVTDTQVKTDVVDAVKPNNTSFKKNSKVSVKTTNNKLSDAENVVLINKKAGVELPSTEKVNESEKIEGNPKKRKKNWLQRLLD